MPKVKALKTTIQGMTYEATLHVNSQGQFRATRPGTLEDWPGIHYMDITGTEAEKVETEWLRACLDLAERSSTERKVIIVRFDSQLIRSGVRGDSCGQENYLTLEALICLETATTQGGQTSLVYSEHPEYADLHGKEQPFHPRMQIQRYRLRRPTQDWTVAEWTQELEDTLVRACDGIQAIVDMLAKVTATPDSLKLAANQLAMLPTPVPFIKGPVVCKQDEWEALTERQRQFLIEAEGGGLRYMIEDGEVCAWGPAYGGIFSMTVDAQRHPEDGHLITLPEEPEVID